jgi:hypothetical protein
MDRTRTFAVAMLALATTGVPGAAAETPAIVMGIDTLTAIGDVTDRHRWDASDDRLDGDVRYIANPMWIEGLAVTVASVSLALDNEGGGWMGEATGLLLPPGTDRPALRSGYTAILSGHGGYAGLTAYLDIRYTGDGPGTFEGIIFAGSMPANPVQ